MEQHIKANAELVVQELRKLNGPEFGYTAESVKWLEGWIERLRESGELSSVEMREKLTSVYGSFLGECIIRCYGGAWTQREGVWCVAFDGDNAAFPFNKIAKQINNGLEDGIATFFTVITEYFPDLVRSTSTLSKKPWWKFW